MGRDQIPLISLVLHHRYSYRQTMLDLSLKYYLARRSLHTTTTVRFLPISAFKHFHALLQLSRNFPLSAVLAKGQDLAASTQSEEKDLGLQ